MMNNLVFYFDFLSPYSYLAWRRLKNSQVILKKYKVKVIFRPVTMSTIIHSYDTKGPAEIPSKRDFLTRAALRRSVKEKIEFTFPKELPFNSLYALRSVLCPSVKDCQEELVHQIFMSGWSRGEGLGTEEDMSKIWELCGLDVKKIGNEVMSRDVRRALKQNNKEALENGVFGVPSFLWRGELFWGDDSFDDLIAVIEGKDLLNQNNYENLLKNYFNTEVE